MLIERSDKLMTKNFSEMTIDELDKLDLSSMAYTQLGALKNEIDKRIKKYDNVTVVEESTGRIVDDNNQSYCSDKKGECERLWLLFILVERHEKQAKIIPMYN